MTITDYTDLLILGLAIAGIGTLGFLVFFSDKNNPVNRTFLAFALISILWGGLNFASYQAETEQLSLWLWRLVIFSAVWFCYCIFHLSLIYPRQTSPLSVLYKRFFIPLVASSSLLTLTPLIFSHLAHPPLRGVVPEIINGPLIPVFGLTVVALVVGAIFNFIKKMIGAPNDERGKYWSILLGTFVTFTLLIIFNYLIPTNFKIYTFIPYGAVFILPFIAAVGYAIVRFKLFNIRVIATEIFAFVLVLVALLQALFSVSLLELVFRSSVFILVLLFSILLIRATVNELRQREHIEQLAESLRNANARLKELDTLKSQFLSLATHELRAPLTIVRNFISLVMEGAYGKLPVAAEEGLEKVFERATEMTHSIDNYLNVSRIEQGRMTYDFSEIDIVAMVKSAYEAHKPESEKKGLKYTMSLAVNAVSVRIDKEKINEVLNNLIDNAIKYTTKGSVYIAVENLGGKFRFSIKDSGVGMSKDTISNTLFKLFSTAANSKSVNISSTGIGLFVSKSHVEACGGKIWAESEGEGKGSTFVVEFPVFSSSFSKKI